MLAEPCYILKPNPRANVFTPVEGPVLWLLLHKCLLPRFLHFIGIMENQLEKKMEHEMETGMVMGYIRVILGLVK